MLLEILWCCLVSVAVGCTAMAGFFPRKAGLWALLAGVFAAAGVCAAVTSDEDPILLLIYLLILALTAMLFMRRRQE